MDAKEIKKLIELEKKKLNDFLKLIQLFELSEKEKEEQINFSLDRINELKQKLKILKS
jgi:hypothetical protein